MVHGVAIVTGFVAFRLGVVAGSSDAVTTSGEKATIGARVGGNPVAIIALFVGLDFRVAAFPWYISNDDLLTRTCDEEKKKDRPQNVKLHGDLLANPKVNGLGIFGATLGVIVAATGGSPDILRYASVGVFGATLQCT